MLRKIGILAATAGLGLAMIGGTARAAGIDGTGTIGTCTFTGKAKIKPKLTTGGTLTPVVTKIKGTLTNCSGGTMDGTTVTTGKIKGLINSTNTNDCIALASTTLPSFTATIKWKVTSGSPKLNPTTVTFAASPPGSIVLGPTAVTINLTGTNTAGSFNGNSVTTIAVTDQTLTDFGTACGGKGLKGFDFNNVNGASSVSF